jgi:hypothetical protein
LGKSQKSGFEWILQMFDGEKKTQKKTPTSPRISRETIKKIKKMPMFDSQIKSNSPNSHLGDKLYP